MYPSRNTFQQKRVIRCHGKSKLENGIFFGKDTFEEHFLKKEGGNKEGKFEASCRKGNKSLYEMRGKRETEENEFRSTNVSLENSEAGLYLLIQRGRGQW
jgi:hypothetical protein